MAPAAPPPSSTPRRAGPLRVGVLASGEGTNLQALLDRLPQHEARVVGVASDCPDSRALRRAGDAGVRTGAFALEAYATRVDRDEAMVAWLRSRDVDLVVLAGYMALVTPGFVDAFSERIVNVHPSLLPAFPGLHAVEQALERGVKVFGVSVHLVDTGVDSGPILAQRAVSLPAARRPEEVLAVLHPIEHELLVDVVGAFARGGVRRDPGHPSRMLVN